MRYRCSSVMSLIEIPSSPVQMCSSPSCRVNALAEHFQVVAIDQRGYNKSDQPEGIENYTMDKLVGDVVAVVDHFNQEKAVIVGHDWGGMVTRESYARRCHELAQARQWQREEKLRRR